VILNTDRIDLSATFFDDRECSRVAEALAQRVGGDGPFGRRVEARLGELLGSRVLLTTSCTHALELALLALGIGPGQEVVCPSYTFVSTANAVLRVGARPVFADIDEETLGLSPRDVERRLTASTTCLLPVHYGGMAPDMDGLSRIAGERRLRVVEDAAQGFPAALDGRPLGTLGDAGCFSFHETKNVTCGEGGAVTFKDAAVTQRAEVMREKGTNRQAFMRGEIDKYTWVSEGSSYVLADLLAAVLDAQLDKLAEIQARRRAVVEQYQARLEGWARARGIRLPPGDARRETSHHVFYLIFADEGARDATQMALRQRGIASAFHYVPLHSSPFGRSLGPQPSLPATDRIARTLLRLPLHPRLTEADVSRVVEALKAALS
jgi:dTDP-4-amino-4,6-dideoxygalactose transaminase